MRAAIVTGVSRGLGEALAADLLGRGFRVLGVGRTDSPRLAHDAYRFVACDLADSDWRALPPIKDDRWPEKAPPPVDSR